MSETSNLKIVMLVLIGVVILVGGGLITLAMAEAQTLPDGPSELVWDRTACANCRMHVGEPAFAAQLQTESGRILAFDDPGCLFLYLKKEHPDVHAIYFRHMKEDRWIARDEVAFVEVSPTPMGFGLGAVDKGTKDSFSLEEAKQRAIKKRQ
jgi:hypothetical protein